MVLIDAEGRPVAVEIEVAQAANQLDGFFQAIKYRAMLKADWKRHGHDTACRAMLVAHDLDPQIISLCEQHDVEAYVIQIESLPQEKTPPAA